MQKGYFITFEGGEGAGKTTLITKVFENLSARFPHVLQTRAPGGTKTGTKIRELVLHKQDFSLSLRTELLLFLADRAQHVEEIIRPALRKGDVVLCDRFNDSTIAYQGGARGIGEELVTRLCDFASDDLHPTLTLYLDIDPRIGLARVAESRGIKDRIEEEKITFHEKIRSSFLSIARKEPKRVRVIDATRPAQKVFEEAMSLIDAIF